MKTCLYVGLAMLLGIGAGAGMAVLRVQLVPWDEELSRRPVDSRQAAAAADSLRPKVVLDGEEYAFGTLDIDAHGQHDFRLTNAGNAPLVLTKGPTTCACAVSKLEHDELQPGQSAKVTLQWRSQGNVGPYRQSATILTNDPIHPRVTLSVSGRMTAVVRVTPEELTFSRISADESATGEVRLYCYQPEPLKITGYELAAGDTADQFDVTYEPIPSDQLGAEPEARSGYLVKITAKSGLPLGLILQTITIKTNLPTHPTIRIPVRGTVSGDISIGGPKWDASKGMLRLGVVESRKGIEHKLVIVTRGPHRKEVNFKPVRIVPDVLQVKLGKTVEINNGIATQTPLLIQIPKGSRRVSYLGKSPGELGQITIQTNHPQVPQLLILVWFAVEG